MISGTLTVRQCEVLALLTEWPGRTAQELQEHTAMRGVWKRLSELRKKGYLVEKGTKKCSITGRNAIVWSLATRGKKVESMRALSYDHVSKCVRCPNLGKDHCPSIGSEAADLMIIGASPGKDEVEAREPFVGPSGELVDGMLAEIPLGREDVYIANVLKCRPLQNRAGKPKEIKTCFSLWLKDEIKAVNPGVILLLGKDAWSITPAKWEPKHHKVIRIMGRVFVYCWHPSYFLRQANVGGFLKVAEVVKRELER